MPKMTSQVNNPADALKGGGGGLKEPSDLPVSPTGKASGGKPGATPGGKPGGEPGGRALP